MKKSYLELVRIFKKVQVLRSTTSLLRWDAQVMMPKKSYLLRATQLSTLHQLTQEMVDSKEVDEHLKNVLLQNDGFDLYEQKNIALMKREHIHLSALPHRLVEKINNGIGDAEAAWLAAKARHDYQLFVPGFEKLLTLIQEKALRLSQVLQVSPYDALLDEFDPKRKQSDIDRLFAKAKPWFPKIIYDCQKNDINPLDNNTGIYSKRKQKILCDKLLTLMHFPMQNGRLDESIHPFTEGTAQDIRITTRFDKRNPLNTVMALMHELGHALYDSALPSQFQFQLVGKDAGMVIHEGVALFWEKIVGSQLSFAKWLSQYFTEYFNDAIWTPENIYHYLTRIDPHKMRIEADEISYLAHIILRYEIEKALFSQEITVKDIPSMWEELTEKLLGYKTDSASLDCMQDIHWAHGCFGYFPAYGLGFIFAAQIHEFIQNQNPHIFYALDHGNYTPLLEWLTENIFKWGSFYGSDEIITHATKQPLNCDFYFSYLKNKYKT